MKRFHIAIGANDIKKTIADYTNRLGVDPCVIIGNEYALFKTDHINLSIRQSEEKGLRHLGWEDENYTDFKLEKDINGYEWEYFNEKLQKEEILSVWPDSKENNEFLL